MTEIEIKIPSISGLATTAALIVVQNKVAEVSNLIKRQVMTQKYQTLKLNMLLQVILINLLNILLLIRNK